MKKQAFTLIEILVASTIIIVLMSIGVASFRTAGQSSRNAKRKADMETIRQAFVLRRSEVANYGTANTTTWSTLMGYISGYISGPTPTDPGSNTYVGATTGTPAASSFCFCAVMEGGTAGNHSSANNCAAFAATGPSYCVANP